MSWLANRRRGAGKSLPYDAEVEYLEDSGTQYIDTLVVPVVSPRIVIDIKFMYHTDADCFGFASNTMPSFIGDIYQSGGTIKGYYRYYNTNSIVFSYETGETLVTARDFHVIDASNNVYIDGTQVSTNSIQSFAANQQSIRIFKGRPNLSSSKQIRSCKIYDGSDLKRDFIPVRVGQTGYMYDKVSGQLFGNSGSGNFVLGPDVNSINIVSQEQQREMY